MWARRENKSITKHVLGIIFLGNYHSNKVELNFIYFQDDGVVKHEYGFRCQCSGVRKDQVLLSLVFLCFPET